MTGIDFVDWIIGSVAAVASIFGIIAGGLKMLSEGRNLKQNPKTPYDVLANRVEKLEKSDEKNSADLHRIRSQVYRLAGVLTREVNTVILWHETGRKPPSPDKEVAIIRDIITELKEDQKEDTHA